MVKITYDPEADVFYIKTSENLKPVEAIPVNEDVLVDVSEDGKIVGIEILNAKKNLGEAFINKQEAKIL